MEGRASKAQRSGTVQKTSLVRGRPRQQGNEYTQQHKRNIQFMKLVVCTSLLRLQPFAPAQITHPGESTACISPGAAEM